MYYPFLVSSVDTLESTQEHSVPIELEELVKFDNFVVRLLGYDSSIIFALEVLL